MIAHVIALRLQKRPAATKNKRKRKYAADHLSVLTAMTVERLCSGQKDKKERKYGPRFCRSRGLKGGYRVSWKRQFFLSFAAS